MLVTIKINGRDALPIRSIPQVTSWKDSPDKIVNTLAAPKTTRVGSKEIRNRYNELFAYQVDAQGRYEQVPPEQWESWVVTLDSLTKKSRANEREGADRENHASWRIKAVLELPDNVFIWLDEFQAWHSRTRPIILDGPDILDWDNIRPEDVDGFVVEENDRLCLTPIFPPDIENRLWRYAEGFDATKPEGLQETIVIHPQPVVAGEQIVIHHHHYPPAAAPEALPPADAATVEVPTAEQPGQKAAVAEKVRPNKKTWDDVKLRALWEESLLPGVKNTILAKKYGVSRQRIGALIEQAKDKFSTLGSTKKNTYSMLMVHKMGD